MSKMEVVPDMKNLTRVTRMLEGGYRINNTKKICVALGLAAHKGSGKTAEKYNQVNRTAINPYLTSLPNCSHHKQVAIELRLRALKFRDNTDLVPTAAEMELPEDEFEVAMRGAEINGCPGHYHQLSGTNPASSAKS